MTSINVVLEPDRVHVFADGGHFSGKVLKRIGVKTYPLPRYNAVLAWSGPSSDVSYVLDAVTMSGAESLPDLLRKIPIMIAGFGWKHPFSAIFVGVFTGAAMGITVEQDGKVKPLKAWNTVKALPSKVSFDPSDIVGSGLRMMDDQRATHGIVAGFVQHVAVEHGRIETKILKRWPDLVAGGGGVTHAAKIGDLEVDTINIALNAISGVVQGSVTIIVPNQEDLVVSLYASVSYLCNGRANTNIATDFILRRTRDTKNLTHEYMTIPINAPTGYVNETLAQSTAFMDEDALDDEEYTLILNPVASSGALNGGTSPGTYVRTTLLIALYRKL